MSKAYILELRKEGLDLETLYSRKRLPDSPFVALGIKTKLWWQENLVSASGIESLIDSLISTLPIKWEQYGGFVLLPQGSFEKEWQVAFQLLVPEKHSGVKEAALDYFENVVAPALNADHLALKVSIPADDVLRRPKVTPLFGKHWDAAALLSPQSEKYTGSIFWAQVRQNNLYYVWSPLHTMFSAGNITEKARISSQNPVFCASDKVVVDLYGGIGYFTFPYLIHAGARLVYACEWNSWSVLGLIQGAIKNSIPFELADVYQSKYSESFQIIEKHCPSQYKAYIGLKPEDRKLVICPGNNEDYLPLFKNKAQHVNLGLIPSSIQGYPLAVQAIDETTGGFLHIHENVNDDSIEKLKAEVIDKIYNLFQELRPEREWSVTPQTHVEVVKSYGPHIYHVVFDLFCHPKSP
ncbi:S-adenosylmethionine-dependent methyltransferase [Entomophthora muscae]|uniref:S-adenosylmethionine-dependent methyltransferase n=1 Tax=Entomophthora muscae TaxID=34485 RepID=A0ACC2USR6_9FUNG|nr:S-adenosylmethionine-dependent methyltransferase [Entomophthora muscae]